MDFFGAQERARRGTRWLVLWFALAVAGIVAVVYLALVFGTRFSNDAQAAPTTLWRPVLLGWTLAGVGGLILAGSLYKLARLARNGGATIALDLGGRPVSRSTTDVRERRLVNVVDEMAIAAGIPAPPVYVLDAEAGINAFAAGARPAEAVIAVTRGTLEQLDRDQLQGVVAHEFSHILNGDMRLNLRLVAVLHGIVLLTLAGRTLLRGARGSGRNGAPLAIAGMMLVVTGYLGVFAGKLIKAGVSRQREFLADASAVQFTRNPQGIAGALARIADIGSDIHHPGAEEASHMFFGTGSKLSSLLATHPPVDERIRRIDPAWKVRERIRGKPRASTADLPPAGVSGFAAGIGQVSPEHLVRGRTLIAGLPDGLVDVLHRPRGARTALFALLLSRQADTLTRQLDGIEVRFGAEVRAECAELAATLRTLPAGRRLPLLDLALPALSEFPKGARDEIVTVVDALVAADGRTSTFEFVARRLLRAVLDPAPAGAPHMRVPAARLRSDVARLLSLLAHAGHAQEDDARAAFTAAAAIAPFDALEFQADRKGFSSADLDALLERLASTTPHFRARIIDACASAVSHDGHLHATELELLRACCQALDAPMPLLEE